MTTQKGFKPEGGWIILSPIEAAIKNKIEAIGTPLKNWDINIYRGILTGFNEAFIIDKKTRDALIADSPKNAEIIRPIIRGRDIKSYSIQHADTYVIFTRRGIDIKKYPGIENHLAQYYEDLKPKNNGELRGRKPGPYKWFEIQDNVAYYNDFEKEKIVWIELTDKPNFALDINGYYINNTIFFITGQYLKYLLAFLNSRLCEWYFDKIAATSGVGTRRWIKIYIDQICVPIPKEHQEQAIARLVDTISIDNKELISNKINQEIYKLFELSTSESDVIETADL